MLELTLEGVTKKYGDKKAVSGVSCTLGQGVYGLLGANGSGKTTLLRMICGILEATEGSIRYGGSRIGELGAEYRRVLGYLPQGSTNDFAASLRISGDPAEAAAAIARNVPRLLDVGFWNGRSFLYVASFGAFTRSSYAAPQAAKNALGHFAYILEGMKDLSTLRPYRVRLTAGGECLDGEYLFGAVCNSTSIGGLMKLNPERVVLDDGLFELLLVPSPKTAADLQSLVHALLNQQYDSQGLVFRHVSSIRLETEEDLPWSLDGEFAPSAPVVDIENRRQALAMLL